MLCLKCVHGLGFSFGFRVQGLNLGFRVFGSLHSEFDGFGTLGFGGGGGGVRMLAQFVLPVLPSCAHASV